MRKWIGLVTGVLCVLSSSLRADEASIEPIELAAAPEVPAADELTPKQVGKASAESMNTAKNSYAAKYVLAASAVAIGIAALILVSRHHGHHHHNTHN